MIRAAAKNHPFVYVLVDSADYAPLIAHLKGPTSPEEDMKMRKRLAWKAYQHCASYDSVVAEYLWSEIGEGSAAPELCVPMSLMDTLRYGENPHQPAAVYADDSLAEAEGMGVGRAILHHGKEMSYNNYLDAEAAFSCVSDFPTSDPTCVIVKHTNPCGVASASGSDGDILEAYRQAVRADPISAFGGIVAFNCELTEEMAKELREFRSPTDDETRMFYEIVIAPRTPRRVSKCSRASPRTFASSRLSPGPLLHLCARLAAAGSSSPPTSLVPEDIHFEVVSNTHPTHEQSTRSSSRGGSSSTSSPTPSPSPPRASPRHGFWAAQPGQLGAHRAGEGRGRGGGFGARVRCVLPVRMG